MSEGTFKMLFLFPINFSTERKPIDFTLHKRLHCYSSIHVFVKDLSITFYIFLCSSLSISLFSKCFTIAKECISITTGWRKLCYSGRWNMLVVGVRSGTIEVQLPKVWTISRGVKPYLEQFKKFMLSFCSTSCQPVGGVYICSSLNQQLDHLRLIALNCRVQPWNKDIQLNARKAGTPWIFDSQKKPI